MATEDKCVSEDHADFIGPVRWDREHLEIVKAGKDAINEWRDPGLAQELWLQHAPLSYARLEGAMLFGARLEGAQLDFARLTGAYLGNAHLENACLAFSHLDGHVFLAGAHLMGADLFRAQLNGAHLKQANLKGALLTQASLQGANLTDARLEEAILYEVNLKGANLIGTGLEKADLRWTNLEGANLEMASVDGTTILDGISVDAETNMTGVGLGNVRIEPHIRSRLEYNIRRIGWNERYKENFWLRLFPGVILWLSKYGYGTTRLVSCFVLAALVFALIYLIPTQVPPWAPDWWPTLECEPFVSGLDEEIDSDGNFRWGLTWSRALYFSVVTMTTLGFGDIHAHPQSILGHWLLMLHVVIGYILLGALITRFAILFQSVEG